MQTCFRVTNWKPTYLDDNDWDAQDKAYETFHAMLEMETFPAKKSCLQPCTVTRPTIFLNGKTQTGIEPILFFNLDFQLINLDKFFLPF